MSSETIYALSSGRLPAGVAVVRVSGACARFALETIFGASQAPRSLTYGAFRGADGKILDRGLAAFFPAPSSFTGEDCVELHCHGGRAVVASLLARLAEIPGLRPAEAGEFSRRAFLNGKFDLTEAEGLADLVGAETEAQRRFALANSEGAQSGLYASWRRRILHARAMIEAELDFADEGDVPGSIASHIWSDIGSLERDIGDHLGGYRQAEMIRDGFRVVIAGPPNAGKSSLLNVLARREVAIVSEEPGTTRDVLDVTLDLDGNKVIVSDTAGLRHEPGSIEAIGIERARGRLAEADLVLLLTDVTAPANVDIVSRGAIWRVGAKSDLLRAGKGDVSGYEIALSSTTGAGVSDLLMLISAEAAARIGDCQTIAPSRERHIFLLNRCRSALREALAGEGALELRAEELRLASDALGRITGKIDVEDLLDVIFSEFCIGK